MSAPNCAPGARGNRRSAIRAVAGGAESEERPQPAHRARRGRSRQSVLRPHRLGGRSRGRGLGLFAGRLQQRRKARNREAHLSRIRMLGCDGAVLVPVGAADQYRASRFRGPAFRRCCSAARSRATASTPSPSTTLRRPPGDELSARPRPHADRLDHRPAAADHRSRPPRRHAARRWPRAGSRPEPGHVRSGEFREDVAYSVARDMLRQPDRPTALYVANGVMALGVMRAIADLGLRCPRRYLDRLDRHDRRHRRPAAAADPHRASRSST